MGIVVNSWFCIFKVHFRFILIHFANTKKFLKSAQLQKGSDDRGTDLMGNNEKRAKSGFVS